MHSDDSAGDTRPSVHLDSLDFTCKSQEPYYWLHVRIISSTLLACKVTEGMPCGLAATLTGDQQFRIHGAELDLIDNSGEVTARSIAARKE
jgi:hypothetical protein